ncbi:TRAP transporter small permease [Pseudothermotoga thermarum]|uniref:TRAP transporter small permease n=1 Tax=Pseudothermotoga thermarum TaxID=119394 RepID=UPI000314699B|nr:TRAP transporter small permease [Pseudothermotoga thermarum]
MNLKRGEKQVNRKDYLLLFEKNAAKILITSMIILVFVSGVARFLKNPINWAVDMSTFMFAWACFFAIDVAWRENKMMAVDLLVRRLPKKAQKVIRIVNYLIISAFMVYLVIWGSQLTYTMRFRRFLGMPAVSYSWVTLSVPVGGCLILRTTIEKIINELKSRNKGDERTC